MFPAENSVSQSSENDEISQHNSGFVLKKNHSTSDKEKTPNVIRRFETGDDQTSVVQHDAQSLVDYPTERKMEDPRLN